MPLPMSVPVNVLEPRVFVHTFAIGLEKGWFEVKTRQGQGHRQRQWQGQGKPRSLPNYTVRCIYD